jgi:glutamine---fructose-6-phosphate transaminase (isomerizing)
MGIMQTEISQQPQTIKRLLSRENANIAAVAAALRSRKPAFILIVARGTSDNAATYAKYLFGLVNHTVVALAAPSLTTLYDARLDLTQAAVIAISQSGESADVIEVLQRARSTGALTIAVTNNGDSALAKGAEYPILLHAGLEQALPATKTYTAELAALALLSAHMAQDRVLLDGLARLPGAMQEALKLNKLMAETAGRFKAAQRLVCLARGINYATALEAALKLKETCYIGAEPYSTADFMHGPIAVVDEEFPALLFAPPGRAQDSMREIALALSLRNAASVIIGREPALLEMAAIPVVMPAEVDELLSPLLYIIPAQLFALHLAQAKGLNPDAPRGLNKVTITR